MNVSLDAVAARFGPKTSIWIQAKRAGNQIGLDQLCRKKNEGQS